MSGMNSQIHFFIDTASLDKLRIEAENLEISVGELIRRKLADPPVQEALQGRQDREARAELPLDAQYPRRRVPRDLAKREPRREAALDRPRSRRAHHPH